MSYTLLPMDYTLLSLLAPGPAQGWELEHAINRRSSAELFRRYVKAESRRQARDVLPVFEVEQVLPTLERLERAQLIKDAEPADINGVTGAPDERPNERTYALTKEGREMFLWWINAIWPVGSLDTPVATPLGDSG
jgi:hypothetical protein